MASAVFLTPPKPLADESPSHASRAALRLCKLCAAILNPKLGRPAGFLRRQEPAAHLFCKAGCCEALAAHEWAVQRARYMSLETIAPLSHHLSVSLPLIAA
jgi:hypothetical protein